MRQVYIFDVDGTLTPARQLIDKMFEQQFIRWLRSKDVYLASGSDLQKLKHQLPESILNSVNGVFTCMGNCLYQQGQKIYQNNFDEPVGLRSALNASLEQSLFAKRCGNHIEERIGMINFSVVGRNASLKERKEYARYDEEKGERHKLASYLNRRFEGKIKAVVGGEISIDIFNPGKDKSQVLKYLESNHLVGGDTSISFFGDKTNPGGNDYALAEALRGSAYQHTVVNVNNWEETRKNLI